MINNIKCFFGKHKRIYPDEETCIRNGWISEIFAPWKCEHCDKTNLPKIIPPCPLVPLPKLDNYKATKPQVAKIHYIKNKYKKVDNET